ncbi:MAG: c-type cytochrome [Nitrospinae bacterium]|nr:c-type cytochrome [Nitrospinota bacterium]
MRGPDSMVKKYLFLAFILTTLGPVQAQSGAQEKVQTQETKKKYSVDANIVLSKARENYLLHCSQCHGEKGDGKGPVGESLDAPPRNHQDSAIMGRRTDEDIFKVISGGGLALGLSESMPPHSSIIPEDERRGLVKYIRKLCNCEYKK